jgi:hypothetical protein
MWQIDAEGTKRYIEAVWNAHIYDWSVLDFSRHGNYDLEMGKVWDDTNHVVACAPGVKETKKGKRAIELITGMIMVWLQQFHLQSVLRHKQVAGGRPPATFRPKRLRKKHEHPAFEHTIIQMEVDSPEPGQTGRSIFQPKKRLHQVRGFYRHYKKTGKKVWVKPHWRGDENLGVIRRDIELVTHEENIADVS